MNFLSLCFTLWCVVGPQLEGKVDPPPFTLTLGQETFSKTAPTDRFIIGEQYRVFAGVASDMHRTLDAVVGYFPLQIRLPRLTLEAGGSVTTTHRWSWTARARLKIAGPLHVEYWRLDPTISAMAVAFRWTPGGQQGPGYEPRPIR